MSPPIKRLIEKTTESAGNATERKASDTTECRNGSGKRPLNEDDSEERSFKRQRFEALTEEEHHEWELPEELVRYANKYIEKYVQEKSLKDTVLIENPVPNNVAKPRKLDGYFKELMDERSRRRELVTDNSLEKIQERIRNIFGPLSKLWFRIEEAMASNEGDVQINLSEMSEYVEQTVMLTGQAINNVTYQRRLNILNSIEEKQKARTTLKNQTSILETPNAFLFGDSFRKLIKDSFKAKKELKEILPREGGSHHKSSSYKRSFPKGPSSSRQQDGGRITTVKKFQPGNNNGGRQSGHQRRFNGKKNLTEGTLLQHSSYTTTNSKICRVSTFKSAKSCPSHDTDIIPKKGLKQFPTGRKVKAFCGKLESANKQSKNFTMGVWPQGRLHDRTHSKQNTSSGKNVKTGICPYKSGGDSYVGERCHSKVLPSKGTISKQPVSCRQERWGEQVSNKLKESKCIYPLHTLQNGRFASTEGFINGERLSMQNRLEGRILLHPLAHEPSKIYPISMGWPIIRIPLPMFWSRASSMDLHKTDEDSHSHPQKNQCTGNYIPRRHVANESNQRGPICSPGHIDFSVTTVRLHHKLKEVSSIPRTEIRISGNGSRLNEYDSDITRRKSSKANSEMQIFDFEPRDHSVGGNKSDRVSLLNSPSSDSSFFASKVLTTTTDTITEREVPVSSCVICLNQEAIQELHWWANNLELSNGKSLLKPVTKTLIQTDASKKGWGAFCRTVSVGGQWTQQESKLHINILELKAIHLALLTFSKMFQMKYVHFQIDNMTALSYLMKMGGTVNREMIPLSKEIWNFAISKEITITAEYLPGKLNIRADWASRHFQDSSEWLLSPKVFHKITQRWGTPEINLFASTDIPTSKLCISGDQNL